MTLKPYLAFLLAATLAASCGQPTRRNAECVGSLETSAKQTTVKTVSGPVAGYVDDGVFIYKGIPYAKAERFAPAVDPDPWTDVRPSRAFGPTAPAPARSGWWSDDQAFTMHWDDGFHDEDCLRVNVWTGGINDGKKRPVMVWLHGGGFREGSGQELICYDGTNLARDHGVVVVSLNHRLNVLGFLDLSAFGAKYAHSGNLGMMDIVKALEWVRDNIANFGGDPANVTIFGQSGGGGKVSTLMAMPSAKGLFSKAIVESGSITNLLSPKYSRRIGAATVANLGLTPSRIEDIATVPYDKLLAAYDAAMKTVAEEAREDGAFPANLLDAILFGQVPVVDGEIIPAQPGRRIARPRVARPCICISSRGSRPCWTAPWAAPTALRFPSSSTTSSFTAPSRAGETMPSSSATALAASGRTLPRREFRPPKGCRSGKLIPRP